MSDLYKDFFGDEFIKKIDEEQKRKAIREFKDKKKEPIIKRRDLVLKILWERFEEAISRDMGGFVDDDGTFHVDKLDEYIAKRMEEYEKFGITQVNEYYDAKLKEIDDMKVTAERRSKES